MDKGSAIFITSSGYDPAQGKHVKDPYLGDTPTLGACRPDIRKKINIGDYLFLVSGSIPKFTQYIVGGFQVAEKIDATTAFERFPKQRLRLLEDGQLTGNIIVDSQGRQHHLDNHDSFDRRKENYIVGCNPIVLSTEEEIARGREKTMEILHQLFGKSGLIPRDIIGRMSKLDNEQVRRLQNWLMSLKTATPKLVRKAVAGRTSRPTQAYSMHN
jgi:hypothetical protein